MIPNVRPWRVRVVDNNKTVETLVIEAPTRRLAILAVRQDYPRTWGKELVLSCNWRESRAS